MLAPEPKALAASSVTRPATLDNRSNLQNDSGVRTPTQLTDCASGLLTAITEKPIQMTAESIEPEAAGVGRKKE